MLALCVVGLAAGAYWLQDIVDPRVRALGGVLCFITLVAACSSNLRAVNWRTVGVGFALQLLLALFILKFEVAGMRPGYAFFAAIAAAVTQFLEFTNAGSQFVFGGLADPALMAELFPNGFVLAFAALPIIIFVSSFFTVLYYFGVLQFVVRTMAKPMMHLLGTSGAETLSAAANVLMGVTEAPLMVKPYVEKMTQSELLALMVGGLATIAGSMMAVYISLGADPVAMLATSVMAAPCGLYLSKILLPETEHPPFWELPPAVWSRVIDVNVNGPFLMARAAVGHMVAQGWGRVIGVTTNLDTMIRGIPYGPSKAGHEALVAAMARELEGTGVTANALLPGGGTNTNFNQRWDRDRSALVQPEVMGPPAVWLASEAADGVNGMRVIAMHWDERRSAEENLEQAAAPAAWPQLGRRPPAA